MNTQPIKTQSEVGNERSTSKSFYALMILVVLALLIIITKLAGLY